MKKDFFRLVLLALITILVFSVSCDLISGKNKSSDDDDSDGSEENGGDDDGSDDDADGGTWTDPTSGLTWQINPSTMSFGQAEAYCNSLTLAGGGWHLPTISELRTLIRGCDGTVTGGSCGLTDSCLGYSCKDASCNGCNIGSGPNNGCYGPSELPGACEGYWSSSNVADDGDYAWEVYFDEGSIYDRLSFGVATTSPARCVRP